MKFMAKKRLLLNKLKHTKFRHNKPNINSINFPSNVLYSPLEKCTWRFNLPEMNNSNYIMLYGISFFREITFEEFKTQIVDKSVNLWHDIEYVKRIGKNEVKKASINLNAIGKEDVFNIFAIIVPRSSILDTTDKDVTEHIKSNKTEKEEVLLRNICLKKKLEIYMYPPKVRPIRENSRLLEILEPALYKVINTNCIKAGAVGEKEINTIIAKYNNQSISTKVKEEPINKESNKPIKNQDTSKKGQFFRDEEVNQTIEKIGRLFGKKGKKNND